MTQGRETLPEYCDHCGEELLRCISCGKVIKKNRGWSIHMDYDGTGPTAGSYHHPCLDRAKADARSVPSSSPRTAAE